MHHSRSSAAEPRNSHGMARRWSKNWPLTPSTSALLASHTALSARGGTVQISISYRQPLYLKGYFSASPRPTA